MTAAVLVGCGTRQTSNRQQDSQSLPPEQTASDFQFLRFGMTFHDITNRVGAPDRRIGSGQQRWEYDLADGSQIVIMPLQDPTNTVVYWFGQRRGDDWLWLKSQDAK